MVNKYLLLFCYCFLIFKSISAQNKQTEKVAQTWVGYLNQTRLSNKWGFWAEAQQRTKDKFINGASQTLLRFGVTHYINNDTKLTAGYGFINHYPAGNIKISQPEHRPWQQIQWHTKYAKNRTMQWIRLEERYRRKLRNDSTLSNAYGFNFRIRYNFLWQLPLSKKGLVAKATSFIVNDEIHVNFGKQIVYNHFDQNRFFLGLNYQFSATDNLQFGYMNLFTQLPSGNRFRSIHTLRIFYFQNLDWRK